MNFFKVRVACSKITVLFLLASAPPFASAQNALTAEQWRKDLHYLAAEIPRIHRDAFHDVSHRDFDIAVASLDKKIPQLSDRSMVVELARLVALLLSLIHI